MAALIVSAGWWIAIVELMPESMRPYIGGSDNSIMELVPATTDSGRLTGNEVGSVVPGRHWWVGWTGRYRRHVGRDRHWPHV